MKSASTRSAAERAEEIQVAQGLADRPLADAQFLREARLDDALIGLQLPAEDRIDEVFLHVFAKNAPGDGADT
jgi:hypothetical protein